MQSLTVAQEESTFGMYIPRNARGQSLLDLMFATAVLVLLSQVYTSLRMVQVPMPLLLKAAPQAVATAVSVTTSHLSTLLHLRLS